MKIDCDSCEVKDIACGDCVVNLFLSLPAPEIDVQERDDLTLSETRALDVMARSGLIPRLQLVQNRQRNAG
ncbi:MAG: hypothetical protein RL410_573 [Actinomycetota bacterium]|jgi:hypothetical protein